MALAGLILASWPGQPLISGEIAEIAQRTRSEHLNRRDQNQMERGYYEHLINVNRNSAGLWDQLEEKPANWDNLDDTAAAVHPGTFILTELAPNSETVFKNRPLRTNRWGMRDQDYEKAKPPNTTRLAFMGSSHVMGSGVDNNQVFEQLLEQRLNAGEFAHAASTTRCSISAWRPTAPCSSFMRWTTRSPAFDPDVDRLRADGRRRALHPASPEHGHSRRNRHPLRLRQEDRDRPEADRCQLR